MKKYRMPNMPELSRDPDEWFEEIMKIISWYQEGLSGVVEANNRLHDALDPPWLPCSLRMPEINQFVLVALPHGQPNVALAKYIRVYDSRDLSDLSEEELEDIDLDETRFLIGSSYHMGITHWMYLPNLPKGT